MSDIVSCRVCAGAFHQPALLEYLGAPQSAQGFLDTFDQPDTLVDMRIFQCACCGQVQHVLPAVSYYRDVIRAVAYSEEMGHFRATQLSQWIDDHQLAKKRVLEVGCGKGEYLDLLRQAGSLHLSGLEHAVEGVEAAKVKGHDARQGYLSAGFASPWHGSFDAFAIFSFLEHWPDINTSLRTLLPMLATEAVGLVEVPNFEHIVANSLYSEFTTDHIFYFDQHMLRAVLERNGFDVMGIDTVWHGYILSAKVKKKKALATANFLRTQEHIAGQLNAFVARFKPGKVVVWGAGHQALAVMSIARLESTISHVVDSAVFKQHKYTPGTRLLIKPPESLLQDEPQAVVIMAAAYSDEIARTIRKDYPLIKHVAILREDNLEVLANEH